MSQPTATREIEGITLPPAGTYEFDRSHTQVEFVSRHMLTKVRGRFTEFDGQITIGERPEDSHVEVEIDAASIQTNFEMRDDHLKSGDFLDVERFPKLTFRSKEIRLTGGNTFQIVGDLTIRDVTNEVVLDAEFDGSGPGLQGGTLAAFSATTEIEREDWDMTWNMAVETGGVLVGKKARIEIAVEAVQPGEEE
jgi:polyisoprenoid-binding protein YceI